MALTTPPPTPPLPPLPSVIRLSDPPVEVKHQILLNLPEFNSLNALSCTRWALLCATREYRASLLFSAYMMDVGFGGAVMNSEIDTEYSTNLFACDVE